MVARSAFRLILAELLAEAAILPQGRVIKKSLGQKM